MSTRLQRAASLFAAALSLGSFPSLGQIFWIGPANGAWSNSTHWNPAAIPPSGPTTALRFIGGSSPSVVDAPWIVDLVDIGTAFPFRLEGSPLTFGGVGSSRIMSSIASHEITNGIVVDTSTLQVLVTTPLHLSGGTTGGGNVQVSLPGPLTVSNTLGHSGYTLVIGGSHLILNGTSTVPGAVINDGVLEIPAATDTTFSQDVTGSGSVDIHGGATGTFIGFSQVAVQLGANLGGTLVDVGALVLDGTLDTAVASNVGSFTGAAAAQLNINGGSFTAGDATSGNFLGTLGGNGTFIKVGTGTQGLFGATLPLGPVEVHDGTLQLGNGVTGPLFATGGLVTQAPGLLDLYVTGVGLNAGTINGTGDLLVRGNAVCTCQHLGDTEVAAGGFLGGLIPNTDQLTVAGTLTTGGAAARTLTGTASGIINANGLFQVGSGGGTSTYPGTLNANASGVVRSVAPGRLVLTGFVNMPPPAVLEVQAGATLRIGDNTPQPAFFDNVTNDGTLELRPLTPMAANQSIQGTGSIHVMSGTVTSLATAFNGPGTGAITVDAGATLNGGISASPFLTLDGTLNTGGANLRGIAGTGLLNSNGGMLRIGNGSTADSTFDGVIAGTSGAIGGFFVQGLHTLTLTAAHSYVGTTEILSGARLLLTGSMQTEMNVLGTLGGTGSVNQQVVIQGSGVLAPGVGIGSFQTGNLFMFGQLAAEIGGATPGAQHDQVQVTGTVNLIGATLVVSGAYTLGAGDSVVLIDNDGGDAISGTFTGLPEGATFMFNGGLVRITYVGGDGNDIALMSGAYTATPTVGANGAINPPGAQSVAFNSSAVYDVQPAFKFAPNAPTGTCGGSITGTGPYTYTSAPITANCTVNFTFQQVIFTATPVVGANGSIFPTGAQNVVAGSSASFTVTPDPNYTASIGGTCGGSIVAGVYTSPVLTADCTVNVIFTQTTFTVTTTITGPGTINPPGNQMLALGLTAGFLVIPDPGYTASVGGTCGGSLNTTTNQYTSAPVTADCTAAVTFASGAVTTYTGPSATGSGSITASFTGGGPTCTYGVSQYIPLSGHARSPPAGSAPTNTTFPHGLFDFTTTLCTPGSTITMTVTYPTALPAGTQYWKYGPTPGNATPHWYQLPATIAGNTATFTITDGGLGDDDLAANGTIVDQGGPGAPGAPGTPSAIPTLSEWMLMLLATLMLFMVILRERRRPKDLLEKR